MLPQYTETTIYPIYSEHVLSQYTETTIYPTIERTCATQIYRNYYIHNIHLIYATQYRETTLYPMNREHVLPQYTETDSIRNHYRENICYSNIDKPLSTQYTENMCYPNIQRGLAQLVT